MSFVAVLQASLQWQQVAMRLPGAFLADELPGAFVEVDGVVEAFVAATAKGNAAEGHFFGGGVHEDLAVVELVGQLARLVDVEHVLRRPVRVVADGGGRERRRYALPEGTARCRGQTSVPEEEP